MKFQPLSEEEAAAQSGGTWPNGTYDFEVREATEKESKSSGAAMIELELWIYDQAGDRRLVFDYLVESVGWKLRQFATSCGLLPQYDKGVLMANEMVGRTGKCEIAIRKQEGYADKNVVKAYVKAAAGTVPVRHAPASKVKAPPLWTEKAPAGDIDDDIPF